MQVMKTNSCALIPVITNSYVLFPIRYSEIWRHYKQCVASFWTPEEIDLGGDMRDWDRLNDNERHFISHVLAFFAASDGNEHLFCMVSRGTR
jgi:ribonucleotide reductase beta subunit family protein with ferritin-like domain